MKRKNRMLVLFTATALLMQSLGCSPALAAQPTAEQAYSVAVDSQVPVTDEATDEVYVYGLGKEDKEAEKAAKKAVKEEEKAAKKADKEEEKAAKKAQKEAIKQAKEQYKYEKKVQKKKVKENSVKDSDIEWNLQMVNTEGASQETGRKIKLALIDSGVDYTDDIDVKLRKNFVPGHEEVSILYEDISGHGTSVAGILAAKDNDEGITGINPNLELYSAKVLDENRMAPVSRVVEAIYWAIENDVDIINISFGTTTDSEELYEAIRAAYDAGILIVAAAGNSGVVEYPAAYGEVIAVGSVDNMGNRSEGSAVGDALELVAPGELVLSTGAFYGVAVFSGTSMAAPHVAGIASLLWEKDPDCSADFIRFLLASTANLYGNPEEYGNGVVDYEAAVSQYEALKDAYEELEASGTVTADYSGLADRMQVEYNDSEIDVFEDLDYVEGSWEKTYHATLVEKKLGSVLTEQDLTFVKRGAMAPDKYIKDMRVHPEWHGYASKYNGDVLEYSVNYIECYIYLTEIAAAVRNGAEPRTVEAKVGISSDCEENIQKIFDNSKYVEEGLNKYKIEESDGLSSSEESFVSWNTLLGVEPGTDDYNHFRSLYIYGMALHTVTDMFAHSVHTDADGYLSHAKGSDKTDKVENRIKCCRAMIGKLAEHFMCDDPEPASVKDYKYMMNYYDGSFKLYWFAEYMKDADKNYYLKSENKNVFDSISYDEKERK